MATAWAPVDVDSPICRAFAWSRPYRSHSMSRTPIKKTLLRQQRRRAQLKVRTRRPGQLGAVAFAVPCLLLQRCLMQSFSASLLPLRHRDAHGYLGLIWNAPCLGQRSCAELPAQHPEHGEVGHQLKYCCCPELLENSAGCGRQAAPYLAKAWIFLLWLGSNDCRKATARIQSSFRSGRHYRT